MISKSFDIQQFGNSVFQTIDGIRASYTAGITINESRINAFYRALGLPAILISSMNNSNIDSLNNGNLFTKQADINGISQTDLLAREANFFNPVTDQEIATALDTSGKGFNLSNALSNRIRGSLLPMAVNGSIPILPQENRVAGAFFPNDSQITVSGTVYKRPFLETIISIRLKGTGIQDQTLINNLISQFGLTNDQVNNLTFNNYSDAIISNFATILSGLGNSIIQINNDLGRIRDQTLNAVLAQAGGIPVENSDTITYVELQSDLGNNSPTIANLVGSLDLQQQALASANQVNQVFFTLLDYDDTIKGITTKTQNARNALLANDFLNLMNLNDTALQMETNDNQDRLSNISTLLKQAQAELDLVTGQFTGFSALDALLIILALFTIEQEDLLGLLNDDGLDRLNAVKSTNFQRGVGVSQVSDSIVSLQNQLTSLYNGVNNIVNNSLKNLIASSRKK